MPYSVPGVATPPPPAPLPMHSAGRPGHRRSYTFALDDPTHVGAFASLGALPRRAKPAPYSAPPTPPAAKRAGVFHFRNDEEDDSSPDDDDKHPSNNDDDNDGPPPPLRLRQPPPSPLRLTPPTGAIPFPRASPTGMSTPQLPPPQRPPGPQRTSSHPVILLSNGKPLKSSLKSSSSAPNVHGRNNNNNHHGQQPPFHLRARSAPSTPQFQVGDAEEDEDTAPLSPTTPKNVHFPAASDQLATVLLFRRSARPASVLSLPGDDAETETETEASDRDMRWRGAVGSWAGGSKRDGHHAHGRPGSPGYPFPPTPLAGSSFASPLGPRRHSHHGHHHHPHSQKGSSEGKEGEWHYALDAPGVPRAAGKEDMVLLEGFVLSAEGAHPCFSSSTDSATASSGEGEADPQMHLHGTLLARNCAFEKKVFVRFTLDGWDTTSEVGGRYVESLGADAGVDAVSAAAAGAGGVSAREAGEEGPGPGWDRFAFSIRLTDYAGRGSATGSTSTASTTTSSSASNSQASGLQSEGRAPRTRKQLPPGSTTGLAPHLARRALVLVARFCVPWVERGGVAPYVWGDELVASSPPASSSSSSPDSAATKPPRVWTGTGGGCAGEWWDNNSGRDYKIGFRVVPGLGGDSSSESESSSSSEGEKGAVAVGGEGGAPKPNGESEDTAAEGIPFPTSTGDASEEGAAPLIHGKPHVPVPRPHLRSLPSLAVARAAGALSPASPAGQQQHAGSPHGDDGAHAHAHSNGAHTHAPHTHGAHAPHIPHAPHAPHAHTHGAHAHTHAPGPPPAHPIPPPPPPRTAQAQALAAKLGRLSLRNYAAPGGRGAAAVPAAASLSIPIPPASSPPAGSPSTPPATGVPATAGESTQAAKAPEPGQRSAGGVGLHWPWGRGASSAPAAPAAVSTATATASTAAVAPPPTATQHEHEHEDDDSSSVASSDGGLREGEAAETPPTSPLGGGGGVLPEVLLEGEGGAKMDSTETPEPLSGSGASTPTNPAVSVVEETPDVADVDVDAKVEEKEDNGNGKETEESAAGLTITAPVLPSAADASSSLYKAFVRQWCFAGASGGGAGATPAAGGTPGYLG